MTQASTAKTQLITYPDSLGGDLAALDRLLSGPLAGLFPGGVHLLPPFPSSGDRGFAPITYMEVDPAFGDLDDLARLGRHGGLTVDVMVNHMSRQSPQFREFVACGRNAASADLFITLDKVWPDGPPPPADIEAIFLRKPEHPFSDIPIETTGDVERIWTSFGPRVDWSEQIDLDIESPLTWRLYDMWFAHLAAHGVTTVRLDAIGYVVKRAGTSCFMVEPDIWDFFDRITALAKDHGLGVLPEVHDTRNTFEAVADRGHTAYNFALPGLILDAVLSGDGSHLDRELRSCPPNQVTMLDCHDGIPVQPDLIGLLPLDRLERLVETCVDRGANINRLLAADAGTFDAHQINITYPDACGSDDAYLAARAIQLFAPGIAQIYYVGLLAGPSDLQAVSETGEGRSINRHNYTEAEVGRALERPVVRSLFDLIRLRNTHPAFDGRFEVLTTSPTELALRWSADDAECTLYVDLTHPSPQVTATP